MTQNVLRLYYKTLGSHVHVRVFCGPATYTLAKCGDLVFRSAEWQEIQLLLRNAEILPETTSLFPPPARRHDEND